MNEEKELVLVTGIAVGIALVILSLPRGKRSQEHYSSWDRYVI